MVRFSVLSICVCAVLVCSVFVNDVDAKRGISFGRRKSGGSSRRTGYHPKQQYKPPPAAPPQSNKDSVNSHFLDAERNKPPTNPKPQANTGPVGFEHFQTSGNKPQTNAAPIGFEHFQNPANKPQTPVGFESFNKPNVPSAPAMPVPHQNIPNGPPMPPNTNIGFNQPIGGGSFSSNQYPGKVNNPYQTNPNYAWDSHSNTQFKPANTYPNNGYPNSGFQHNPSQSFGNNYYPNTGYPSYPNTGYPSYPNNYFGGSHYGAPNSFGNPQFGNSYNPYGNSYFPGGGNGYGGYPGQFGYNNYKPKSKFGFGGLPLPIPIPIPIPLGGFGFGGLGGNRKDDYSHSVLNSLLNTTSLNSTANATSIYVVNNVTVVSCTNELFTYGPNNVTVTTCTADNCTSVKVYVANNSSWTLTMCLGSNVTVTSNSSGAEVSNVTSYWQMICAVSANSTLNDTATNTTSQNSTETPVTTTESNQNATSSSNSSVDLADMTNSTDRLCEILNCSYVEMCLPETAVDNNTRTAYRQCVRIKMCKSPSTPISHHVTLNTTIIKYDGANRTESYSMNNITVLAFYPVKNNCSTGNDTSCLPPFTNATDSVQINNSTVPTCSGGEGTPPACEPTTTVKGTSDNNNSSSSISPDLLKVLESEANKYNTSLSSLLQYLNHRDS